MDSLYAILVRLELQRRYLELARKTLDVGDAKTADSSKTKAKFRFIMKLFTPKKCLETKDAEHVATIWAAYEEVGWLDASEHFLIQKSQRGKNAINEKERWIIREASHDLSSRRQQSSRLTLLPVCMLAISLVTAIVRTFHDIEINDYSRINNETAHNIAILCLLFIFMPLVIFSGSLSSALTVNGSAEVIDEMRRKLREARPTDPPLFPDLVINRETSNSLFPKQSGRVDESYTIHDYSGTPLNHTWRPWKDMQTPKSQKCLRSHSCLYVESFILVVCGSSLPAIFLSATNHTYGKMTGLGCRSLSWLSISSFRVLSSVVFDSILNKVLLKRSTNIPANIEYLWLWTIRKDALFVFVTCLLILFEQIGVYNNCWCRSSFSGFVNLNDYLPNAVRTLHFFWSSLAPGGFLFSLLLTLVILLTGNGLTGVMCRSQDQLKKDGEAISSYKKRA